MRTPNTPRSRCAGRSSASATTSCARSSSTSPCRRRSSSDSRFRIRRCAGTRGRSTSRLARSTGASFRRCCRATAPATASALRHAARRTKPANGCAKPPPPTPTRRGAAPPEQEHPVSTPVPRQDWPLYEVFIRSRAGLEHKHVGSVHAADARMALEHARDVYTRRMEGVSIWVVPAVQIVASDPAEADALFEPARDKVYRHPTFYAIPDEVKNL
ncbi:MAG: 1,2-phenylacetyl-CoA epoxidase subunit B [Gammaproteobacteria bacterium]|nr:1,2-phenylacetyl-CoA epoxidase subunit B [Gammaproteobacteria bacterium]MBV9619970.1 1,2-phenylacetyl-CoA epoxidase subunit B [Gammaproteobacteria bacterium]